MTIRNARGAAGAAIYRTALSGPPGRKGSTALTFRIPVANGTYRVRLHHAETVGAAVGKRRFDVNIEGGRKELAGLDVRAEAGGL